MPKVPLEDRPHSLYRFFNDQGDLLYIGITADLMMRWNAHHADKDWWRSVSYSTIQHFANRTTVFAAERAAILAEKPRYNVTHNRRSKATVSGSFALPDGLVDFTSAQLKIDGATWNLTIRWQVREGRLQTAGVRLTSCDLAAADGWPEVAGLGDEGSELRTTTLRALPLATHQRAGSLLVRERFTAARSAA